MASEPFPMTSPGTSRTTDPTGRARRRRMAAAILLGTTIEGDGDVIVAGFKALLVRERVA